MIVTIKVILIKEKTREATEFQIHSFKHEDNKNWSQS